MSTIITRLYESNDQATAAVAELKRSAFGDDLVSVIGAKGPVPQGVPAAIAEGVRGGKTAVAVRAPFGNAAKATEILNRFNPTDVGATDTAFAASEISAAPLSTAFGLPLISEDPAPLSSLLGMRLLSRTPPVTKLIDKAAPFSQALNIPLLANVSTSFGMPPLTDGKPIFGNELSNISTSFGFPQLSSNPAPMSAAMGMPVLLSDE